MKRRKRDVLVPAGLGVVSVSVYQVSHNPVAMAVVIVCGLCVVAGVVVAVSRWLERSVIRVRRNTDGLFELESRPFHIEEAYDEFAEYDRFVGEEEVRLDEREE